MGYRRFTGASPNSNICHWHQYVAKTSATTPSFFGPNREESHTHYFCTTPASAMGLGIPCLIVTSACTAQRTPTHSTCHVRLGFLDRPNAQREDAASPAVILQPSRSTESRWSELNTNYAPVVTTRMACHARSASKRELRAKAGSEHPCHFVFVFPPSTIRTRSASSLGAALCPR